jgi:anhydro-N-acetylmuramic acid kinase
MSGSSLDGLDLAFVEFNEQGGQWDYEILETACYPYTEEWTRKLQGAIGLSSRDYLLLHSEYGHYIGEQVNKFIGEYHLNFKVAVIASHGHTTFHIPSQKMTAQLGDGSAIAAETQLPVVTDLRAMDVAMGGQGAPIVPIGEKLLLSEYDLFLNLGGISNISSGGSTASTNGYIAFDVCPANRVLNMLAAKAGREYDEGGKIAATGKIDDGLLEKLNTLPYYKQPYPKSLANDFGTATVYPLIEGTGCSTEDALRTYTEHIAIQIREAVALVKGIHTGNPGAATQKLLVTGGGAHNKFLVSRLADYLSPMNIDPVVPDERMVNYKEAMIMAFIGVLRWRHEYNVLSSVTGSVRDSIGGALWIGQEA